jgi:TM2 domain-containing membrane protein YozV
MSNVLMKSKLNTEDQMIVASEFGKKQKNKGIMYALWFFLTPLAGHRFYLGDTGYAVCMLLFGWCSLFIWNLVDVFFIGKRLDAKNEEIEQQIIQDIMIMRGYKEDN